MTREAKALSAYPLPPREITVVYKGSFASVVGDPKWERRRIVDPEYKDHIEHEEGWYTFVAFAPGGDWCGFKYVPLAKLNNPDGTPYKQPPAPSERPAPTPDPYFYSGDKPVITLAPYLKLLRFFANELFDYAVPGQARRVSSTPPTETWRALQPPAVREFKQNHYEGHKFFGNLVVTADDAEGAAVYTNADGHIWIVKGVGDEVWAVRGNA